MAERPPYVSDEDWAKHCLENGIDLNSDRVVPFERKRRRREPPPPPPGGWPSWNDKLRRENGRVIPDLANALIALREERELAFAMSFNEMLQRSIVDAEWPHAPRALPAAPPPHEVGDDDVSRLQEWLQHMGMPRVGRETVKQAVEVYARERRVHAIRDWLNNIEWDGVHRTPTWLRACLGCPDDEYQRQIGPMFLISMVARIFQPGCKCDYMIVLEGPQGEEKSKFCRALAGGDQYFSEHLPPIDGDPVRLAMHLRGPWLIEVAELASMLKSDPEATKHFVSRQIEKYTPKYGHGEVVEPRQCVLVGTTNEDDYIRDVTGGRRYWPVAVASVNIDALNGMREQLFAEAVALYREGKPWWPDRQFEKAFITPIQDGRQYEDALAERVDEITKPLAEISLAQLGARLGYDNTRFDMAAQKRVAGILRRARWKKVAVRGGIKVWRKSE